MRRYQAFNMTFVTLLAVFVIVIALGIARVVNHLAQDENKRRFKNIYSSYTQALLNTVVEMSGDTGCYYSSDKSVKHNFSNCDTFYKLFVSNLQLQKYCKTNSLKDGCIPLYQSYTDKNQCHGFTRTMMNNIADSFVMADSSNIIVYNELDKQRRPIFAVDVNGKSKPNKAGIDLFSLTIIRNGNGSYYFHGNVSYCLPVEKDGIKNIADVYK